MFTPEEQTLQTSIRVALVEDHHIVRAGLSCLIGKLDGVEIVGEASTGPQSLKLIEKEQPDIAIYDINLPGKNGLQCCAELTRRLPTIKVLILSMEVSSAFVHQAVQAGAAGYLVKDAAPSELEVAIMALARNESYFSPVVSTHLIKSMRRQSHTAEPPPGENPFRKITPRQREVLCLLLDGCNTKEIASRLKLSVKTVESHRQEIQRRLDTHDLASLTRLAIRWNFISSTLTLDFD